MHKELVCRSCADNFASNGPSVTSRSPAILAGPVDAAMLAAEWTFRQIYWRSPLIRSWIKGRRSARGAVPQVAERNALLNYLRQIGVDEGALVMAHTSVSGLTINDGASTPNPASNPMQTASELVSILIDLVGESGTLCMPAHPLYKTATSDAAASKTEAIPVYNPRSTPCAVGLANELFWRKAGTERSLHPHNSLAARGPLATELLRDNLNNSKPLAHGVNSGYYRFCLRNGLLISVGVPLMRYLTLSHVGEESLDENWSVPDFFEERTYTLRNGGQDRTVTVRKTRGEFMKFSLCNRKFHRDMVRAGIVHEGRVGSVRVDWARAGDVYQYISERNRTSTYPFFLTRLVPQKANSHA